MKKCVWFNPMYIWTKCEKCQKGVGTTCATCSLCIACHKRMSLLDSIKMKLKLILLVLKGK